MNTTVSGLDQYHQANELDVAFRGGQPVLSAAACKQLDDFAANLAGHQGYVLEIEGHSPQASTAGIQSSGRLAEAVKRYLVTEDQIPVYRLHSVALGNAPVEIQPGKVDVAFGNLVVAKGGAKLKDAEPVTEPEPAADEPSKPGEIAIGGPDGPEFTLHHIECTRLPKDMPWHNPYGVWRLEKCEGEGEA